MKRVLYIVHRVPYPPDKGDRVRAFHEIEALSKRYRVTVAALAHKQSDRDAAPDLKPWCEKVIVAPAGGKLGLLRGSMCLLRGRSVTEGYFHSPAMRRVLREEASREPFDLVMGYSSGVLDLVLDVPARAHVMDLVDVDSAKWESYAAKASAPLRWLYRREGRGVRALELRTVDRCDAVLMVSEAEAEAMRLESAKLVPVVNGVDSEYFSPRAGAPGSGPSLVFTGTMDYRPNVEGVCWFVGEVWPRLRERLPGLTFDVVGRDPLRAVLRLRDVPGVHVTGSVPDVRPYLARAAAAVAPLHIGRGIQNKVLEAMAMGRAVVASREALEGLDVTPGTEVLQADTVEEWTERVSNVISNGELRGALERAARRCVEEKYSWTSRMSKLTSLCERLLGEEQAARPADASVRQDAGSAAGKVQPAAMPEGSSR